MKLTFLILFLIPCLSLADEYLQENSDLYPALDIYEVSQQVFKFGFRELDLKRSGVLLQGSLDQVYFSQQKPDELAILKFDLQLASGQRLLKISANEFICHGKTSRNRAFSLYVKGRSASDMTTICGSLSRSLKCQSRFYIHKLLFSEAQASELSPTCSESRAPKQIISNLQGQVQESVLVQQLGTCLASGLRGSKDSIREIKNGLQDLLKNPQALWSELSAQGRALLEFVRHLESEMISLKKTLSDLNNDLILEIGCHLGAEVLASVGLSALTGAGVLKLSVTMEQAVMKLKNMKSIFSRLNKLALAGKAKIAKEVLSCEAN